MTMSAVARLAKLTYAAARCIGFKEALSSICVASILVAIIPKGAARQAIYANE